VSRRACARLACLAGCAAGCVSIDAPDAVWEPAAAITGALAPDRGPPVTPPSRGTTLRVTTWNVHFGADPAAFAADLAATPALAATDVLLVQEIDAHPDEGVTRTAALAGALGMTWVYVPEREHEGGTHGNAILSRFPLVDVQVMTLPRVEQPVNERNRVAVRATVDLGDRAITIANVHLDTRIGPVDRIRQLDPAAASLPDAALLGGDLNTLPWTWVESLVPLTGTEAIVGQDQAQILDDYLAALGYTTPIPHDADTFTGPFSMRLDAVFARGLAIVAGAVERGVDRSDHWPVWVDIAL
jgi:endonuclease/exonuclease/phosphatase family metal-dependent hydrolase